MAILIRTDFLGEWADNGYNLFEELGDVFVALYYKGYYICSFNQTTLTKEAVHEACQEHWDNLISQEVY